MPKKKRKPMAQPTAIFDAWNMRSALDIKCQGNVLNLKDTKQWWDVKVVVKIGHPLLEFWADQLLCFNLHFCPPTKITLAELKQPIDKAMQDLAPEIRASLAERGLDWERHEVISLLTTARILPHRSKSCA